MPRKLSRNAPCPCGSGKKYKHCCIRKDFEWVETDDGGIARRVEVPEEAMEALEELRQARRPDMAMSQSGFSRKRRRSR